MNEELELSLLGGQVEGRCTFCGQDEGITLIPTEAHGLLCVECHDEHFEGIGAS